MKFLRRGKFRGKNWFHHFDLRTDIEIISAPLSVTEQWSGLVRIPEPGIYSGRVLPLFRCLRAYPLPGPPADRYGDPKKRYIWEHQLGWQKYRVYRFLSDRQDIVMLLGSKLARVEQWSPNRFIPRLDLPQGVTSLSSRLGLWYDGKAYRFLIFESEEDRGRWLKGEDWFDMPSDVDDYQWKTREEQEEESREPEQQRPNDPVSSLPEK